MAEFISSGWIRSEFHGTPAHHHHDTWELHLYTAGTGTFHLGQRRIPLQPGLVVTVPPRVTHHEAAPAGCAVTFIHVRDWVGPGTGAMVFLDDAQESFLSLCTLLDQEQALRRTGWRTMCQALLELLLRHLERWADEGATGDDPVERLKHLFHAHHHQTDFGVGDAMRALPLSADHLRRCFLRATGRTPGRYLTDLRIQAAKHHLAAGATVGEAARRAGLGDPFYFSRIFRRHEGVSPSRWLVDRRTREPEPATFIGDGPSSDVRK